MKDNRQGEAQTEQVWRRPLTGCEVEGLDGSQKRALALDSALTSGLRRLPDAPVSNNFTSRVMREVELHAAAARRRGSRFVVLRWVPRFALILALLGGAYFWHGKAEAERRAEMARSVAVMAPPLPPEVLQDFDAIQVMSRTPPADEQLLALMQ